MQWQVWEKKKPWIIEFIQIEKAYFYAFSLYIYLREAC